MREILFRGKRTFGGKWIYGFYFTEKGKGSFIKELPSSVFNATCLVNPKTVGQYTDLTDKNGKSIFEGDIVKVFGMTGKIVQVRGAFGIHIEPCIDYDRLECEIPHGNNADFCFNDNFISLWELWWNYQQDDEPLEVVEVVGNIYDNPELLKGD